MYSLKTNKLNLLRQPSLDIIFCIFVFFTVGYLLFHGYLYKLAFIVLMASCVYVAFRFPLVTVFLLIILTVLPTIFQMVPEYSDEWMSIGYGIRIQDVVLVSMLGAVILKVIFGVKELSAQNNIKLTLHVILFGLWICFEIIRNISVYGLSAPGEFRYSYLILSVPLYVSFMFPIVQRRKKLLKLLIVSSLFLPIIFIPIIGELKGWRIGPENRFFPASISLGLIYGLLALGLGKKYKIIKISKILYWFIIVFVGVMIIVDSHRSVWLVTVIVGVIIYRIKEINYSKKKNHVLIITFIGLITFMLAQQVLMTDMKTDLIHFIIGRSSDLIKIDESYNNTASWRMVQWKTQMIKYYDSPIIGEGFGGYWGYSGIQGDLGVSPHNMYVQTLVKLGTVGLVIYMIITAKIFVNIKRILTNNEIKNDPDISILIIGFVILVASHVFYIAYSFEYYSLLFIGLAIASLRDKKYLKNE